MSITSTAAAPLATATATAAPASPTVAPASATPTEPVTPPASPAPVPSPASPAPLPSPASPAPVPSPASPAPVASRASTALTSPAKSAAERTGARTTEAVSLIGDARSRIDALDDRIIGLVQERMAVSAVIQEARIASGGRRINLSREMEVLTHFSDALGKPGTPLAMTLLELCRGRV